MPQYLDLENWNRKAQFHFFRNYDQPFFNICAQVDITACQQFTRDKGLSFFLTSLYLATRAANDIPEFRYRLRSEKVLVHEVIHAGSTVLRRDETFGFCYFEYQPDFPTFHESAAQQLTDFLEKNPALDPRDERDDLIHYSVLPWIAFTSISHARRFGTEDSVPKIVFGKYEESGGRIKMPVSVEAHHALMDGLHAGRFFETLQGYLAVPDSILVG